MLLTCHHGVFLSYSRLTLPLDINPQQTIIVLHLEKKSYAQLLIKSAHTETEVVAYMFVLRVFCKMLLYLIMLFFNIARMNTEL